MDTVSCPKCGAANPPNSAFCGTCGTPLAVQQPQAPSGNVPAGWQPPAAPPAQPPGAYQPPPAGVYPPQPPGAYPPPPPGYPQPPGYPYQKIVGNNTKWAVGLGIGSLFCCGPLLSIPGIFMAKKDMDEIAAGRAPQLNEGWAKGAFYLNIICLIISVLGLLFWFGLGGMHRF
jgi:zinc-ribbon domain